MEILVGAALVSVALLTHAATSVSAHRLGRTEQQRSRALEVSRHFLERLRTDADWEGLYGRLRYLTDPEAGNGGTWHPCTAYYADFVVPSVLDNLRVRVEVPRAVSAAGTQIVLREDVAAPRFGLPFDLNGDGTLDEGARDQDYRILPVLLVFRWASPGDPHQTLQVTTWLKGER